MADSGKTLTQQLVDRLNAPVPASARRRAALHWLDWMGCVAAGGRSSTAERIHDYRSPFATATANGEGTPMGGHHGLLGPATDGFHALLLDAGPANVEEMDDMHRQAILHPGPVILPAVAALVRQGRYRADDVLDALVRGYETMIRIGRSVGSHHYHYWHNTATAGTFGAAAACASLLRLSPEQTVWALGNAGTQAAGLWQVRLEPVMSKQLHTAHAAWAGLQSAALASAGMTGPAAILEGERGFYAAMCGDVDQQAVVRHEQDWLIHETSFKPWPACRHTHAVIDCALALRSCAGSDAKLFERCDVYTFDDAVTICDDASPATRIQAKFSLQYCVTAAYLSGPLQLRHFEPQAMAERSVREAMRRVHLYRDAAMTARYPAHFGARVALTGPKGQRLVHEESDALGDPERALSSSQIIDKARALLAYGRVAPSVIDRLLIAVSTLLSGSASDFPTVLTAPFNDPSHNLETRLPVRET